MVDQGALTVRALIKADALGDLRSVLAEISKDVDANSILPFDDFIHLHFARILIAEAAYDVKGELIPPSLVFSSSFDGSREAHIEEILDVAGPGIDRLFSHCEGYPEPPERNRESRRAYLKKHRLNVQAFYVNTIGRGVQQIRQEDQLHNAIAAFLDENDLSAQTPAQIRKTIQDFVFNEPSLVWAREPEPKFPLWWRLWEWTKFFLVILVLLLLSPILLVLLPFYVVLLRYHEIRDNRKAPIRMATRPNPAIQDTEDFVVQNSFSALGNIKPGWFRYSTAIVLLYGIQFAVRHIFNRGNLGGVKPLGLTGVITIHFCRWIVIDDKRRALFFSNYDGSMENYMSDFINKVFWGLNCIFSNGVEYPKTNWLFFDGARDEQAFKSYIWNRQILNQVWHSPYPHLSAVNIANNALIRAGLYGTMSPAKTEVWLRRL